MGQSVLCTGAAMQDEAGAVVWDAGLVLSYYLAHQHSKGPCPHALPLGPPPPPAPPPFTAPFSPHGSFWFNPYGISYGITYHWLVLLQRFSSYSGTFVIWFMGG